MQLPPDKAPLIIVMVGTLGNFLYVNHLVISWKQPLAEMQGKAAYKRPKWSDPSLDPAQAGASCTGAALIIW